MHSKFLILFFVLTLGLFATQGAISVYTVDKEHRFVSEEVILKVDLKTDAFSIRDVKIGLENSKDYVVVSPKSAAYLETVEINDTNWQVVHYEYKLYPLHAGKIRISPINIAFKTSMGYGQPENNFTIQSEALFLDVSAPQGVGKEAFVISTPSYSLKSDISHKILDSNATQIKIGDAIEFKITQEAKNVPDILLRPIHISENSHFKIYKDEPLLNSKEVDSGTIAMRQDSFTLIAVKEGNVSIPSQTLIWWNSEEEVLQEEKIKALHFTVLATPELASSVSNISEQKNQKKLWIFVILFSSLWILILYKFYPYIKKWRVEKKRLYIESEEGRFKLLLDTCKDDDMTELYKHFYYWLEVADPKLSRSGFSGIRKVQSSFSNSLQEFEEVLITSEKVFDKMHFITELKKLRKMLLEEHKNKQRSLLKNINPISK